MKAFEKEEGMASEELGYFTHSNGGKAEFMDTDAGGWGS